MLLSWASTGGTNSLIVVRPTSAGGQGAFTVIHTTNPNGNQTVTPSESTDYKLRVWHSSDPDAFVEQTLTVTVSVPAAVIDSASVSPNPVSLGNSVTITWTTTGADSVLVNVRLGFLTQNRGINLSPDSSLTWTPSDAGDWDIIIVALNSNDETTVRTILDR